MGTNRISTFLHTLASSSGVNVGGVSESIEPDSLFTPYSARGLTSVVVIGKDGSRRGVGEGEESRRSLKRSLPPAVR